MSGESPHPAAVEVRHDVRIPTDDPGVTLSGDLLLPRDAEGPVPAILTVLPYRNDAFGGWAGAAASTWFAERGIAVLLVDFRGTGASDGRPRPPFDPGESDDAIAAIRWLAEQPWCTGRIGMWGASYGAILSMRTAARRPPALAAIAPFVGMIDPERDFVHPLGQTGMLGSIGAWGMTTLGNQLLPPVARGDDPENLGRWTARLDDEPWIIDLWRHGPGDPVWRDRAIDASTIEVPALCVAGWRDLFVDGSFRGYEGMTGPKALVVGPWMHTLPDEAPERPADLRPALLAWWRRWLAGEPVETISGATLHVENAGWRRFPEWDPQGTSSIRLVDGTDAVAPVEDTETVGALSGLYAVPTGGFGLPLDQAADDARGWSADTFVDSDLDIVGRPSARLAARPGRRVIIKIADVDEHGRSTLVCSGVWDGTGRDAAFMPTAYRVAAGHRLRVVLSAGDFPRIWPAGGDPIEVRGLEVVVPVVAGADSEPAGFPAPPPMRPAPISGSGRWSTSVEGRTRTVQIVEAAEGVSGVDGSTAATHRVLTAIAVDGSAEESRLRATAELAVTTAAGRSARVGISLQATPASLEVRAVVTREGDVVLDRTWREPAPGTPAER